MGFDKGVLLCSLFKKQNYIYYVSWIYDYVFIFKDNDIWGFIVKDMVEYIFFIMFIGREYVLFIIIFYF